MKNFGGGEYFFQEARDRTFIKLISSSLTLLQSKLECFSLPHIFRLVLLFSMVCYLPVGLNIVRGLAQSNKRLVDTTRSGLLLKVFL